MIKLARITIIQGHGADHVYLWAADFTEAELPFEGKLCMHFRAAKGTAEKYCSINFAGVPVQVVKQ